MIVILFRKKTQNDNIQLHLLTYKLLVTFVTDNANHMSWKVITFFILTILLVVFTVQNQILLNIQFIHWELKDVPVVYILIAGLIFGFLLSMIIQLPTIMSSLKYLAKARAKSARNCAAPASRPSPGPMTTASKRLRCGKSSARQSGVQWAPWPRGRAIRSGMQELLDAGGLVPYVKKRLAEKKQ